MSHRYGGTGTVFFAAALALLAAGCSGSSDGWAEEEDPYDSGYYDGYDDGWEDGYEDAEPTLGEILIGGAFPGPCGDYHHFEAPPTWAPRWRTAVPPLVRGAGPAGAPVRGEVAIRLSRNLEEFRVEVDDGVHGGILDVFLIDRDGTAFLAGSVLTDYRGAGELRLRSGSLTLLSGGGSSVEALAGAAVEVRAGAAVVLCGRIPSLEGRGSRAAASRARDEATGAGARVRMAGSVAAGRRCVRVDLTGLPSGGEATLLVEDGAGVLVPEGTVVAGEEGTGGFRFDSRRGEPLPGGASDIPDLSGRAYQVRIDGEPAIDGLFPLF